MRCLIVGLGTQGKKRRAVAGNDVVAVVDPMAGGADYRSVHDVPLAGYDAALVCTPDSAKLPVLRHLLENGKHVLVEKPLLAGDAAELRGLAATAQKTGAVCYTAYNHRFEPHLVRLKEVLDSGRLGDVYLARLFYGNGTACDVRHSPWRDDGLGVLADLGSHLLDLARYLFGASADGWQLWQNGCFENQAFDHCVFGRAGTPALELTVSLLSWRNTFTIDIVGSEGSAHVRGLCKWGPSKLTLRERVLPSGKPIEETETLQMPDPTWGTEYRHFRVLCRSQVQTDLSHDVWISTVLAGLNGGSLRREAA